MWAAAFALLQLIGARANVYTFEGRECNDICDMYDAEFGQQSKSGEYWQSLNPNDSQGLEPVIRDSTPAVVEEVQRAARLIHSKTRSPIHNPQEEQYPNCYSEKGRVGCWTSNLARGYPNPSNTIFGYMREFTTHHLCHRRPLLDHNLRCVTASQYGVGSVLKIRAFLNDSCSVAPANVPKFSAWPPPGDVPAQLLFGSRIWHFSRVHPAIPKDNFAATNRPTVRVTNTVTCADVPVTLKYYDNTCGIRGMVRFSADKSGCSVNDPPKGCEPAYTMNQPLLIEVTYPDGQYYSYTTRIVDCSKPKAERCPSRSPSSCALTTGTTGTTGVPPPPPPQPNPQCSESSRIRHLSANNDDGKVTNSNSWRCSNDHLDLGNGRSFGLRFKDLDLDRSRDEVTKATVGFRMKRDGLGGGTGNPKLEIRAEISSSPSGCGSGSKFQSRSLTTASVSWEPVEFDNPMIRYKTPDLSPLINEVLAKKGGISNLMLVIQAKDSSSGNRRVETKEEGTPARLDVSVDCKLAPVAAPKCPADHNCFTKYQDRPRPRMVRGCDCECIDTCMRGVDDWCFDKNWDDQCVAKAKKKCAAGCGMGGAAAVVETGSIRPGCLPKTCSDFPGRCGALPDGCGGITLPCSCSDSAAKCSLNSTCQSCVPRTCTDLGASCGTHADGCGGQLTCGTCDSSSEVCFGGRTCQPNDCVPVEDCRPGQCGTLSMVPCIGTQEAGSANISAGVETVEIPCGGCAGGEEWQCSAIDPTRSAGTCECIPTQTCGARTCGTISDGCGNVVSCGTCPINSPCMASTMTCGPTIECGANQVLQAGACICAPGFAADPDTFECTDLSAVASGAAPGTPGNLVGLFVGAGAALVML